MQRRVLAWPRAAKRVVVVGLDVGISWLATWLAFSLRMDTLNWPSGAQWWVYGLASTLYLPVFVRLGLYRAIFRYTGAAALGTTAQAVAWYAVGLSVVLLTARWDGVPRTLGVLQPLIFFLLVAASRLAARLWLAQGLGLKTRQSGALLIYGAGTAGAQIASALSVSGQYVVLGFVDDDLAKVGRSINAVPVFAAEEVPALVHRLGVTDILLALPSVPRSRRHGIVERLRGLPVHVRTLPALDDLASGRVSVRDIHELDVEDLLGRAPVPPDPALIAHDLRDQVVLVSGAGGSIGSELTRQIVQQQPRTLLLLDHNEFGLYQIHQQLQEICHARGLNVQLIPLLGSVTNPERLNTLCALYQPSTVYHAAAYKHVPLVEGNVSEGLRNNVLGTLYIALAARASRAKKFVLVSTDKAVRPTNVMGASKRLAEMVLQALAAESDSTCFTMVRFGNVLDSSGSVVPLFRSQITLGGPLTVTHPEVTRYFMTIPEAAQLVLQAGALARGGDVFVLDMGEPVRILDLARRMIELSGLRLRDAQNPSGDIEIAITGLRPGEKLYEELLIGDGAQPSPHPRIMKAHEPFLPWSQLQVVLQTLEQAIQNDAHPLMQQTLRSHVHGYQPT